ncbi:hypothetical protein RRG08_046191 [Elysia crispata]|uniref:Uncharacterized protein n=1 Tax=Elysia crispata TaxID=231223 RepID=A0AAE0XNY7_9GAST|nr:hypothetical protein RRG08_046191 [Elysia crispata]
MITTSGELAEQTTAVFTKAGYRYRGDRTPTPELLNIALGPRGHSTEAVEPFTNTLGEIYTQSLPSEDAARRQEN